MATRGGITSIDLFCGAGGLSLGLGAAGVETALASDNWEPAGRTYQRNFSDVPFLPADVAELTSERLLAKAGLDQPPSIIAGGPPCQGFSSAGARRASDGRNGLISVFAQLIAATLPRVFIFENVEGFLTLSDGDFVVDLLDPVIEAGYFVHLRKVNVANYGIPQLRKRVVAIGSLGGPPPFPAPTHRAWGAPGAGRPATLTLPLTPTFDEAIMSLPPPSERPPGTPTDHVKRRLSEFDAARTLALRSGETMRDLPPEYHHASYSRRANRRVKDGMPTEKRGGAPAGLRRLRGDEPSKAITSAASREFIHPAENRPLTLRECARLQTFPDEFDFVGTSSDRATLIGNAVPPRFAKVLGESLMAFLDSPSPPHSNGAGMLVSFEPTFADGKSPALQRVVDRVTSRYALMPTLFGEIE